MTTPTYYTPDYDELCPDLIYEELRRGKYERIEDFTNAYEYEDSPSYAFAKELTAGRIRVKHLDREDIEGEGWKWHYISGAGYDNFEFEKFRICIDFKSMHVVIFQGEDNWDSEESDKLFDGTIRNLTEFRKLMKQLGIKK